MVDESFHNSIRTILVGTNRIDLARMIIQLRINLPPRVLASLIITYGLTVSVRCIDGYISI